MLAEEYQSRHLRVNCINPGGTRTKMRASAFPMTEDPQKFKPWPISCPFTLVLISDDSRRKTGMTFDAQPAANRGYRNE